MSCYLGRKADKSTIFATSQYLERDIPVTTHTANIPPSLNLLKPQPAKFLGFVKIHRGRTPGIQ